jgi:hypothetical protein
MTRDTQVSTPRAPRAVLHASRAKAATTAAPRESAASPVPGELPTVRIAVAAYYLAEKRNFSAGCELDDWLSAERQIDAAEQAVRGTAESK